MGIKCIVDGCTRDAVMTYDTLDEYCEEHRAEWLAAEREHGTTRGGITITDDRADFAEDFAAQSAAVEAHITGRRRR